MGGSNTAWNAVAVCLVCTVVLCFIVLVFTENGAPRMLQNVMIEQKKSSEKQGTQRPQKLTTNAQSKARMNDSKYIVSMRAPNSKIGLKVGRGSLIDLKSNAGIYDAGFVCHVFKLDDLRHQNQHRHDAQIVRIDPFVSEINEHESVVHHMDIFACRSHVIDEMNTLLTRSRESEWCSTDEFLDTSCRRLLWAYDRGAGSYIFPNNTGILLGPSSGFSHMILQIHYLLPEQFAMDIANGKAVTPIEDASGFDLTLESKLREHDASIFGFLDMSINVPVGEEAYRFENHISNTNLAKILSIDLLTFTKIHPFAVHLHAHDHATSVTLTHYRGGKELQTYAYIAPFHGYGPDQTFFALPASADSIELGDSLTFTCIFNNSHGFHPLLYGVSHGDEMCAPLILYYPHVRGKKGYNVMNMIAYSEPMSRNDDVSAGEIRTILGSKSNKLQPRL